MSLTNEFDIGDQNITLDNYNEWHKYLNETYYDRVSSLNLKPCDLRTFLDQVLLPWCTLKGSDELI